MVGQACTALRELELGELDGMCHLAVGAPAPVVHRSQLAAFGHNKPFLRSLSLSSKACCARRHMLFRPKRTDFNRICWYQPGRVNTLLNAS